MALPNASLSTRDGQLGLAESSTDRVLVIGPTSAGTANTLYTHSQPSAAEAALGSGAAITCAGHIMDVAKTSVDIFKSGASVASSNTAVTASGGGPAVSVAGSAYNALAAVVTVVTGGALGVGTFKYTLDGGRTVGETRTIPAGGSFVIPGSGLTLTFAAGTYVAAETYTFSATPATFNSSDLSTAATALLLLNDRWKFIVLAGQAANGASSATLASAIGGHITSLQAQGRYPVAFVDTGNDTAPNVNTAFVAVEDLDLACFFGKQRIIVANPIEGWREPELPYVYGAAARAAKLSRATNIGFVGAGKLEQTSITKPLISFDEAKQGEQLHNKKINTTRTYVGRTGAYPVNGLIKSPAGSDFRFIHWKLAFNALLETVYDALQLYVNASLRVKTDGSGRIHPFEAARINKEVNQKIRIAVLDPLTEQGRGYFSDVLFAVDETWNMLTSNEMKSNLNAVPLANTEQVSVVAGLTTQIVPTAEAA